MEIQVATKQISQNERFEIERQVKAELIDHLYQGCLPGVIGGIPVGLALLVNFYGHTPLPRIAAWLSFYTLGLVVLTLLYLAYKKYFHKGELDKWLISYSVVMCYCAATWGALVFLIPQEIMRQNFTIIALFFIATGYAAGSIGVFLLCVVTLCIIVLPVVVWAITQASLYYYLLAIFALTFIPFMASINRRSTEWFKTSLKLKLENTLMSYQANHDLLTDLPNQRLLPQYIDATIQAIKNTDNVFALVCFSLNRMELVNDSLGHQAGDFILKTVADRLNAIADRAARGREDVKYFVTIRKDVFNILIAPIKKEEAEAKAKIFFSALDDSIFLEQKNVQLTGSMGLSLYPQDGTDTATLLINADAAMLEAKQFGGNRLETHRAEITSHLPQQVEIETDLYAAIKYKQFKLNYQPLINIHTGYIVGMEALIRWHHPKQGLISPMQFIPVAESTGLILPIGSWVLEEACRQNKIWYDMGFDLRVAVNLSAKQLREDNMIEYIQSVLQKTHLSPANLELEITETAILDEAVIPVLKEFKGLGLSLAVDDFGTGYAGLSYFKRFAINKIKIDQSFIRDIPVNNDSMTIVSAIIAMAKELKVATLAEGVETEEQLQFLKSKGCDYVQGYYFSKPLEVSFFTQLLQSRRYAPTPEAAEG